MFQLSGGPDCVDMESDGQQNAGARHDKLDVPVGMPQQDMLAAVARQQDRCTAWQRRQVERQCRRRRGHLFRNDRQDVWAPAWTPEYGRITPEGVRETERPSAPGRRATQ
ncbi:hypothetical protein GCM10007937_47740 [Mesorhizobium albiziae]|nr:hypothetical protein GCM10007937_47740 [Mesorhizobium albiziae]